MSNFLKHSANKHFTEHHNYPHGEDISMLETDLLPFKLFHNKTECKCFEVKNNARHISYYIGVDWLDEKNELAIYVEPKLNKDSPLQTDYLNMLFSALKHREVAQHTEHLFEIKFDAPYIKIDQEQDLLTPLLVVQFLRIVKEIVRKGLKKSYYKVAQNLYGKVKGKILVAQTIKQNVLKNKALNTVCSYDEFGLNGLENRLLKKALVFIQRYLPTIKHLKAEAYTADVFNYILPALNNNQNTIIEKALNAKNYFLIQGPPGTGKTSTVLKDLVKRLYHNGETIMILAFTNRAVDEICEKLQNIESLNFIRLGRGSKSYCWQTLATEKHLKDLHSTFSETKVFVSTQSTFAANADILQMKSFDTLIVDEASELLEPQLVGFIPHFKRFILIGDKKQLPAVVSQNEESSAVKYKDLSDIHLNNMRESLFSRLLINAQKNGWDCFSMLTHHFRMHEKVADFINKAFYQNHLICGKESQKADITGFNKFSSNAIEQELATNRIIFIPSKRELTSKENECEAKFVKDILELIISTHGERFNAGNSIGVITPFRKQMAKIKNMLPEELQNIAVDTVERYQGSERDIIIISLAVKNSVQLKNIQSISPTGVDRKLNVALSRAREHLIILGVEEVLRKSEIFTQLLDYIKSENGYLGLMPVKAENAEMAIIEDENSDLF